MSNSRPPTDVEIKEAIAKMERMAAPYSKEEGKAVDQDIKKVRLYCLRKFPFFGKISAGLKVVVGTTIRGEFNPTAATDGRRIMVNPHFWNELSGYPQKITLYMHEAMHVAYSHHLRIRSRDHGIWNQACDYRINIKLTEANCSHLDSWLHDAKYSGWSEEAIYKDIYPAQAKEKQDQQDAIDKAIEDFLDEGEQGQGGDGQDGEPMNGGAMGRAVKEVLNKIIGKVVEQMSEDGGSMSESEIRAAEEDLRRSIKSAIESEKRAGKTSTEALESEFSDLLKPKKNWKALLSQFVKNGGTPAGRAWYKLDRRAMANRMYQPHQYKEGIGWMVIGFDASSSMQKPESLALISHLETIRSQVSIERLTIIPFNTSVMTNDIVELKSNEMMPRKFRIGGGTAFSAFLDWVRNAPKKPDIVIICTDMGDNSYGDDIRTPLIWMSTVALTDSYYGSEVPFGRVVEIDINEGK